MGNGPLDGLIGDLTGGGGVSDIESEAVQGAEGLIQQDTGYDASSLISEGESLFGIGGQQASTDGS